MGKDMMNQFIARLVGVALLAAAPVAPAFARATVAVGMPVTDAQGGQVGTVTALKGDNVMVRTDKHEVLLPNSSFTPSNGKLLFGMTQAQLNAEVEKSTAAADAALVAGATVVGLQGAPVGTIESIDAQNATLKLASGKSVTLARSGLRGNADGTVTIGLTVEQLNAAVSQAAGTEGAQ
jgi:preprotein translocase subunit YajC